MKYSINLFAILLYIGIWSCNGSTALSCDHNATKLHRAAWDNHTERINQLIAQGVNIDSHCEEHEPALVKAAEHGSLKAVKLLIKEGADVNIKTKKEPKALLKILSTMTGRTCSVGDTALIRAASEGHLSIVEVLLDNGANRDIQNKIGHTALSAAVSCLNVDIVRLLLKEGADPSIGEFIDAQNRMTIREYVKMMIYEMQQESKLNEDEKIMLGKLQTIEQLLEENQMPSPNSNKVNNNVNSNNNNNVNVTVNVPNNNEGECLPACIKCVGCLAAFL